MGVGGGCGGGTVCVCVCGRGEWYGVCEGGRGVVIRCMCVWRRRAVVRCVLGGGGSGTVYVCGGRGE